MCIYIYIYLSIYICIHVCVCKNVHGLCVFRGIPHPASLAIPWRFVGQNLMDSLGGSTSWASNASLQTARRGEKQVSSKTTQAPCLTTALAFCRSAFAASKSSCISLQGEKQKRHNNHDLSRKYTANVAHLYISKISTWIIFAYRLIYANPLSMLV